MSGLLDSLWAVWILATIVVGTWVIIGAAFRGLPSNVRLERVNKLNYTLTFPREMGQMPMSLHWDGEMWVAGLVHSTDKKGKL